MTNRELARSLGVSPATLSLVINNKPGISAATRQAVKDKLNALGLSEMVREKPLKAKRRNLCFVVYKRDGQILDSHPFFMLLMESIEARARRYGFNLLFLSVDRRNSLGEQIGRLREMDCAGAVLFATEMFEDDIAPFLDLPFPFVLLDNDFPRLRLDSVAIDNALGSYQAVEYLVGLGHTRIGYLQSAVEIVSFSERAAGYADAMRRFRLEMNPRHIFRLDYTEEGSYQQFREILRRGVKLPGAFVSDDDTIAIGAMRALSEAGVPVPEELSVIGFNNRPAYARFSPALSSVSVPKYAFGAAAIDRLVARIEDDASEQSACSYKCRVGTELVLRDSARPPRRRAPDAATSVSQTTELEGIV